jgi:hypothetical protein
LTISSAKGEYPGRNLGAGCQSFLGDTRTFVFQYGQAFNIDSTLSDGKAALLNGGGFSLFDDVTNGSVVTMITVGFSRTF